MSGRILIVDTVATNRIVLKAKMLSAQFAVDTCSSTTDAKANLATHQPDLILLNMSDRGENRHEFCRQIKADSATRAIAIIAMGVADTARSRLAALDAGADDVLPRPVNNALLLARIRSLLRVRSASQELLLRDSTSQALGFHEAPREFQTAVNIALLSDRPDVANSLRQRLSNGLDRSVRQIDPASVLRNAGPTPASDLFVIDASEMNGGQSALCSLVADLKSRNETRQSKQLIVVPYEQPEIAAMLLDLGADDVVRHGTSDAEILLRAEALIRHKQLHDRLRDMVRNGLHAAVTDPLTGLYNRRYVEPHLIRLAEQSHQSDTKLAIMMLDIDHFKSVNDTYGHAAGDRVLVQMADRLRANLRAIDLLARVGGEEFLVAMPRTTSGQARATANRLRRLVNCRPFDLGDDRQSLRVTVSVGVAVSGYCEPEKTHLTRMCDQADAALYSAKSAGRDQVAMGKSAA